MNFFKIFPKNDDNGHHEHRSASKLSTNTLMANNHCCLDDIRQSPPLEPVVSAMVIFRFDRVGKAEHKLQKQPYDDTDKEPALSDSPSLVQCNNIKATKCQESNNQPHRDCNIQDTGRQQQQPKITPPTAKVAPYVLAVQ
jgi:hypothetical protein